MKRTRAFCALVLAATASLAAPAAAQQNPVGAPAAARARREPGVRGPVPEPGRHVHAVLRLPESEHGGSADDPGWDEQQGRARPARSGSADVLRAAPELRRLRGDRPRQLQPRRPRDLDARGQMASGMRFRVACSPRARRTTCTLAERTGIRRWWCSEAAVSPAARTGRASDPCTQGSDSRSR